MFCLQVLGLRNASRQQKDSFWEIEDSFTSVALVSKTLSCSALGVPLCFFQSARSAAGSSGGHENNLAKARDSGGLASSFLGTLHAHLTA